MVHGIKMSSGCQGKFSRLGWILEELHPNLGARITGIESRPSSFSSEQCLLLQAALASYDLLVFPDQVSTSDAYEAAGDGTEHWRLQLPYGSANLTVSEPGNHLL